MLRNEVTKILSVSALIASFGFSVAIAAECEAPSAPSVELDIAWAEQEDVFVLFKDIKAYQREVASFRECLRDAHLSTPTRTRLHNASVDEEQAVVAEFNEILTVFRTSKSDA